MLSAVDSKENSAASESYPVTGFSGEMVVWRFVWFGFVCLLLLFKHDGNKTGKL